MINGVGNGFGRELDAEQWNGWRAGEHVISEWSGIERSLGNLCFEIWRGGKDNI